MEYSTVKIFFDTNVLEKRIDKSYLPLSSIEFCADFYKIVNLAEKDTRIKLCIPEIVWEEIQTHMQNTFDNALEDMKNDINIYRKTFGKLVDISYDTTYSSKVYKKYLNRQSQEFWEKYKNQCQLIPYLRTEEAIGQLIEKALNHQEPFKKIKKYSDAGFKDAIIVETMLSSCEKSEAGLLFTNDTDFDKTFAQYDTIRFSVIKSYDDLETKIAELLNLSNEHLVMEQFKNNTYIKEQLLSNIGYAYDDSVTEFNVLKVEKKDESFIVSILVIINETSIIIRAEYDDIAREIIDTNYKITNE